MYVCFWMFNILCVHACMYVLYMNYVCVCKHVGIICVYVNMWDLCVCMWQIYTLYTKLLINAGLDTKQNDESMEVTDRSVYSVIILKDDLLVFVDLYMARSWQELHSLVQCYFPIKKKKKN